MSVIRDERRLREVTELVATSVSLQFKCESRTIVDETYGYASVVYSADPPAGVSISVTETGVSLFVVAEGLAIDSSDVGGLEDEAHVAWAAGIVAAAAKFGLIKVRSPKWFPVFSEWVIPRAQAELRHVLSGSAGRITRYWGPWHS